MIKGKVKFILVCFGGLAVMIAIGMIVVTTFSSPTEIRGLDLVSDWMVYRILFYTLIIMTWSPLCHFLTRDKYSDGVEDEETDRSLGEKRVRDIEYLKTLRWKVAASLVFFEIVLIQQMGLN